MNVEIAASGDITILKPQSDIKIDTLLKLRGVFESLIKDGISKVAIDLSNVHLIDSSGVGLLINFGKKQRDNNGCLCLYNFSDEIKELLDFVEMGNFIPIYKNFNEVKKALSD